MSFPDGQCYSITIPKKEQKSLVIILSLYRNASITIYLQDPNTFNGYHITADALPLGQSTYLTNFEVTVAETKLDPKDPKMSCVDYDKFDSFLECSDKKAEERFYPFLGCVPPWFTDDQEKVCQQEDTDRINKQKSLTLKYYKKIIGKFILSIF